MAKAAKNKRIPNLDAAIEHALAGLEQKPNKAARTLYLSVAVYDEFEKKCAQMNLKPSQVLDALIAGFVVKG